MRRERTLQGALHPMVRSMHKSDTLLPFNVAPEILHVQIGAGTGRAPTIPGVKVMRLPACILVLEDPDSRSRSCLKRLFICPWPFSLLFRCEDPNLALSCSRSAEDESNHHEMALDTISLQSAGRLSIEDMYLCDANPFTY